MTPAATYEVVVDVTARRLVSVTERQGEPSITVSEIQATAVVLENAEFKQALAKRGVTDLTKVFCAPFAAGYYAVPEHDGRRLVKVGCFDTRRSTTNVFGWPIERLYALRGSAPARGAERHRLRASCRSADGEPELQRGGRRHAARAAQADAARAARGAQRADRPAAR